MEGSGLGGRYGVDKELRKTGRSDRECKGRRRINWLEKWRWREEVCDACMCNTVFPRAGMGMLGELRALCLPRNREMR